MITSFTELLANPLFWKILISYWIFSAFVGALPTPSQKSSELYIFTFRFFHTLAGNVSRAAVALKVLGAEASDSNGGK